ncbi:hypothetical protein M885DRAFT_622625 [Pelagophyceae sp. CCMP2097]|nr:hypothetical protein M885DRAFT_622625 [Pelagophyceae sp. CCMP2097]|mmetsp:Transcript_13102/g.45325  ORF Transcript_13102/g.45325 Transcript_13102/m.45325 type:complete len:372 (+) Transcript_13102:41-1156(+)
MEPGADADKYWCDEETDANVVAQIREAYLEANPGKLIGGEVDALLLKYGKQERLLLRRVQYRYGLDVVRSPLLLRRQPQKREWVRVECGLRADGRLSWCGAGGGDAGSMDARRCAVDPWGAALAGRESAFAVFDDATELVFAAESDATLQKWLGGLRDTARFFFRLERERAAQQEEAASAEAALQASERTADAENARWRRLQEEENLATRRASALSAIELEAKDREDELQRVWAQLESCLDDALRHSSAAVAAETRGKLRSAHGSYRAAVEDFVHAKLAIGAMAAAGRPEADVLHLIDAGSAQCRAAADACRSRARPGGDAVSAAVAPDAAAEDERAQARFAFQRTTQEILDMPRLVPPEMRKIILDQDDV